MAEVMNNPVLGNPASPFLVWTYGLTFVSVFGYLGYMLWKVYRGSQTPNAKR
jgi:hypothetical protein